MDLSKLTWLNNPSVVNTFTLVVIVLIARFLIVRIIKGKGTTLTGGRRRWLSVVQNMSILLILLGLIYIWSPQLSTFVLSLTAFAVAMVIATKEYLLCVVGALYRATSSPFTVGDWIEVNGLRGEVLTEGMLSTRLQELGKGASRFEYTGRILSIPNSIFLTQTVFNESYRKSYLHHDFRVAIEPGVDPAPIIAKVSKRLTALSDGIDKESEQFWSKLRAKTQTDLPSRRPKVYVETTEIGKIVFIMTVFCAVRDAARIEADLTSLILTSVANPVSKDS